MAVATSVLVGAGISAAAGAYGAKKSSDAAKNAAKTQAASADQATQLQRDIYTQGRQDSMPWLNAGAGAIGTLSNLMGIPQGQQGGYGGQQQPQQQDWGAYLANNPDVMQHYAANTNNIQSEVGSPEEWAQRHFNEYGRAEGRSFGTPQGGQAGSEGNTLGGVGSPTAIGDPQANGTGVDANGYPLASVSGSGLMRAWDTPFNVPDPNKISEDPSYQWRFNEGMKGIQNSAASKGNLLTGSTLKDLTGWGQGMASQEYDKIYGRELGEYQQAYNIYNTNQSNQFNRLSSLAGVGQQANAQQLQAGQNFGAQAGQNMIGAGNANAAGQIGSAGAWGGYANSLGNIGSDIAMNYYRPNGGGGQSSVAPRGGGGVTGLNPNIQNSIRF